jgi:hypothetical protein
MRLSIRMTDKSYWSRFEPLGDHLCWLRHGIGSHLAAETIPCNLAET